MSNPEVDGDDPATIGEFTLAADEFTHATTLRGDPTLELAHSLEGLDTSAVHDTMLRGGAAGSLRIPMDARFGPDGKFVLRQQIGSGGMGRVYRALDRYLLRDVAIKFIFRPDSMAHDDFMALFWQEAHIIARLDQHDNIVRILDVDRSGNPPFIVMEYLDGQSLEAMLKRAPISLRMTLDVTIAAACGLREAHTKGIYHRDLKPSNIFIQKTGRVKLLDFGLARLRHHPDEGMAVEAGFVGARSVPQLIAAGTPAYMAPEQWRGEEADAATDLWAMGVILYRLLADAPPFAADTIAVLSARVLSGDRPVPLTTLCPGLPPVLCDLVDRLLRTDRSERLSDASEVIATLESVLRTTSGSASRIAPAFLQPASFWSSGVWSGSGAHGYLVHDSGSDSVLRYWEKMLLVLVFDDTSGIGDAPQQLPIWLLGNAGVDLDVLHCPLVRPGDVDGSAVRLKRYIDERFRRARHILFITHGAGSEVVLRMLLDEARRLTSLGDGEIALDVRSLLYRTRHVAIFAPGRGVAVAHGMADPFAPPGIASLTADFVAELGAFLAANLPAPALYYFGIDGDNRSPARGLGALDAESAPVRALAQFLVRPDMVLAHESIAQTFELDCAGKIVSLVTPAAASSTETVIPIVPGADGAAQAEAFEHLLATARAQHQRPVTVVITGNAGVGKSTVLRTLARRLCNEAVASLDGDAVLPLFLPLYFVSLPAEQLRDLGSANDAPGQLLELLLDWWCDWVDGVTYAGAIGVDWAKARLRSGPVVLILDGVDEFITNHPALSISNFHQMLTFIGVEYRQNRQLTIMLGVRNTQPGLSSLASGNTVELLRLTTAQAVRQFPAASGWLNAATDSSIKELLLTPLILAQLNTRQPPSVLRPTTRSDVILLALTAIIEQSDLQGRVDEQGEPIDTARWIDALMAIAWCLFRRLRGEIATSALRFEGADLCRSWQDHIAATGQLPQGDRLVSGIRLLCESRACDALLRRTILYPTGRGEVRFIHREWQDFLASRYLAQVVAFRHVDELRHVGYTPRMCRTAGEILCQAEVCIDEALVGALVKRARDTGSRLIEANFSALLTSSRVLIDGPAIDAFLSAVRAMPAIARCIALNGLGYRALRGDDASAHDLRHRLVQVFRDYLSATAADDDLGVIRSIAWCYLKAYAARFGGPPPRGDWPGLGDNAERAVLAMMCSTDEGGPRILAEHRSVQLAFLELQHIVIEDPFRPISGVHYLYCLVVARHHGAGIAELGRELPALLAHDAAYSAMIEHYQMVPELREVLAACHLLERFH